MLDLDLAISTTRDDGQDGAPRKADSDGVGIKPLVGQQRLWRLRRQGDQSVIDLAIDRPADGQVDGERSLEAMQGYEKPDPSRHRCGSEFIRAA